MYNINDYVMHRKKGICQIKDIRSEDFCGTGKETYYIMRSVNDDSSMIYVPQSSHQIRDIMTKEQIEAVVNETEHLEGQWIDDSRARASAFDKILRNGASSDILWLMKVLSIHKKEVESHGKKFYASDEKIFNMARKIITEEFSFSLGIGAEEVVPYILKIIENLS